MISDLDETIRHILLKAGGFDPAEVEISFEIPNREWSSGISKPTLNCYLFDIRENRELRQHGMEQMMKPLGQGIVRQRPPQRFDLTYLITAWTRAVEDEHRLLWHTLATLSRFETIPLDHLQGQLRENVTPIYAHTALPESVLKSPGEFWTALENHLKPSLSYVVNIALEREVELLGPPVLTTRLRYPWTGGVDERWVWFGGSIQDRDGTPVADVQIEIEGRGVTTTTDSSGRFRLRVPAPGRYVLVAHRGDSVQRREIDIPESSYNISFES